MAICANLSYPDRREPLTATMPVRSGVGAIGRCPLAALVVLFEFEMAINGQ